MPDQTQPRAASEFSAAQCSAVPLPHEYAYSHETPSRKLWDEDDMIDYAAEVLKDANRLCRSAMQIALRDGRDTNWPAFRNQLEASLKRQHGIMYPHNRTLGHDGTMTCDQMLQREPPNYVVEWLLRDGKVSRSATLYPTVEAADEDIFLAFRNHQNWSNAWRIVEDVSGKTVRTNEEVKHET